MIRLVRSVFDGSIVEPLREPSHESADRIDLPEPDGYSCRIRSKPEHEETVVAADPPHISSIVCGGI